MGFFSHAFRTIRRAVTRPVRTIKKVVHNPTSAILNKHVRSSKGFRNIARPLIKVGAGVALGAVTGGVGLAGFTALSTAGAVAGGLASVASGGLTSKAFQPVNNVVLPAIAGTFVGNLAKTNVIRSLRLGKKVYDVGSSIKQSVQAVKKKKAIIADMHRRAAAARNVNQEVIKLSQSRAELAALQKAQSATAIKVVRKEQNKKDTKQSTSKKFDTGGALVGAASGAFVAGPIGAAVGGVVGGFVSGRKSA